MTRYVMAAEADQIQDFIFRSSRLVQVVGGSGLLSRFGQEVAPALVHHFGGDPKRDVVVNDGGSFRILFDDPITAQNYGNALAEAYRRATDGTLTTTEPVKYEPGSFKAANDEAEALLGAAKRDERRAEAVAHIPYAAFCASCGVSLAVKHSARFEDERPNYLCESCQHKAEERRFPWTRERFLKRFWNKLTAEGIENLPVEFRRESLPVQAEDVAGPAYDPRSYVAYLLADGNGMGVLFSHCETEDQLRGLSQALSDVLWTALAHATARLCKRLRKPARPVPVLPLILGGDDCFTLLAAPYALDFAHEVCLAFEGEMKRALTAPPLENLAGDPPTMAAAIVICKSNYPYALAHRRGEGLLRRAKRLAKAARLRDGVNHSVVDFDVILGGAVGEMDEDDWKMGRQDVVPSLRPYWVSADGLHSEATQYSLELASLLDQRYKLRHLPAKRRAELRELYLRELPDDTGKVGEKWTPRLKTLLGRIGRRPADLDALKATLAVLGDPLADTPSRWRDPSRPGGGYWAHGLPDLLTVWDFALDLDRPREEYEEETR
jgi:hypothetical protein